MSSHCLSGSLCCASPEAESDSDSSRARPAGSSISGEEFLEGSLKLSDQQWLVSGTKRGRDAHIHTWAADDAKFYICACGRKLKRTAEVFKGWAAVMMLPNQWCPGCKVRLPRALRAVIEEEEARPIN